MSLLEVQIEDIIYDAPWLLDTNFILPNIKGGKGKGRQVNIGNSRINRYIDLLFKDIRDNRPVIVELKKGEVRREDISQILEYKALMITVEDERRECWREEYGMNFMCPKLILVAQSCTEENLISANLAGVDIRLFGERVAQENLLQDIENIKYQINSWQQFLASGQASLLQRNEWIRQKHTEINNIISDLQINSLRLKPLYKTTAKNFWSTDTVFPFINFCISYNNYDAVGIYEYSPFHDEYTYSDKYIYMDILIPSLYEIRNDNSISNEVEMKLFEQMKQLGYSSGQYREGIITIQLDRNLLNDEERLKIILKDKVREALEIIDSIEALR